MGIRGGPIAYSSAGCGCLRRMMAVAASGVSTRSTGSSIVLKGWLSRIVKIEKATSAEVTGVPSWNNASLRR